MDPAADPLSYTPLLLESFQSPSEYGFLGKPWGANTSSFKAFQRASPLAAERLMRIMA